VGQSFFRGCPILAKKLTIALEVLYTGIDAGELNEVSSCNNLSGSDVSNDSGRENENEINPSPQGTSTGYVYVSRRRSLISAAENDRDSCEESDETKSCVSEENESESEESSPRGKVPKRAKTS